MVQIPPRFNLPPLLPLMALCKQTEASAAKPSADQAPNPGAKPDAATDKTLFCPVGEADQSLAFFEMPDDLSADPVDQRADELVDPWAAPELSAVAAGDIIPKYNQGPPVQALQERLNALGQETPLSGVLDSATLDAINHVRQQHDLSAINHVDATSLNALAQAEQTQILEQAAEQARQDAAIDALKAMTPKELHKLGRQDPQAFFKALLPAALESQKQYGIPAALTLAQGALESDYARAPIGGYNIFGIKGQGPAGAVNVKTREVFDGKETFIKADFARYHNFYEAVNSHGKLFHNGYYDKAMAQYKSDGDVSAFIHQIASTYATAPNYARAIERLIETHDLLTLTGAEPEFKPEL